MEDDKIITYAIEQLERIDEAIEKLPGSPVILSGKPAGAFEESFPFPDAKETDEPDFSGKQAWDVESNPLHTAAEITSSYPAIHIASAENTGIFTSFEKMPSHWWQESGDDARRDAVRHVSTTAPAAIFQNTEQPSETGTRIIPFSGMAPNMDITGEWSNRQENFPTMGIAGETASFGMPGEGTRIRAGYPEDEEKKQAMMNLIQHIDSFYKEGATGQPDESRVEEIMKITTYVTEDDKAEKTASENPYIIDSFPDNTVSRPIASSGFSKSRPGIGGYIESTEESIGNSSRAVKNIHISINDGLNNGVQTYFDSSDDDLSTADGFTNKVAESLQTVLHKVIREVV